MLRRRTWGYGQMWLGDMTIWLWSLQARYTDLEKMQLSGKIKSQDSLPTS
jgi:hypothetical protein